MRNILKDKKGFTLGDLQGIVLVLVVIGVLFGAGLYVLAEFEDKINSDATHNESVAGTQNATLALTDLAAWLPIIVVVIAAALVIGIVIRSFSGRT